MAELKEAFGSVLAKYRHRAGMSQEALAFECELHPTYISQIERGLKSPTLRSLFVLAGAMKVSPAAMIKDLEEMLQGKA